MFTPNLASWDRIVRAVLGLALIILPYLVGGPLLANPWLGWGPPAVGVILLATAAISFCPLYAALGIATRKRSARP
jgi:hypothetical protein